MSYKNLLKTFLLLGVFNFSLAMASEAPSSVENVKATPMDGSVKLNWDEASDQDGIILGYVVYYGRTPIDEASDGVYSDYKETGSAETTYTIDGLSNGVTYYFAVTAEDEESNESENYSEEIFTMPLSEAIETPSVISSVQISAEEVEVLMSESVAIKSRTQSFFIVQEDDPTNEIEIIDATVEGEKVYLEMAGGLEPGITYEVTATSAVEDLDGNPVSSGVTDTATFKAKDPSDFIIEDPVIEVNDEEILEPGEVLPKDQVVKPVEPEVEPVARTIEPVHPAAPEVDTTPPRDVTGIIMDPSKMSQGGIATLIWTPAVDEDGDIIDQVIYMKVGNGNWDEGYSVGKTTAIEDLTVKPNSTYMVRIVTIDRAGNQSNGATLSFSTQLTKTGPSSTVLLVIALFVGFLFIATKRKA